MMHDVCAGCNNEHDCRVEVRRAEDVWFHYECWGKDMKAKGFKQVGDRFRIALRNNLFVLMGPNEFEFEFSDMSVKESVIINLASELGKAWPDL